MAIIDGSGVLYDPAGLDRPELIRLAKGRKMISNFDTKKLGPEGYRVLVEEKDVRLPCESNAFHIASHPSVFPIGGNFPRSRSCIAGEVIPDGTDFRNNFHFRVKCDLFVPCGGRPEAVNISNVGQLIDSDGKPNFKYVVEGANLFFTQQSRLFLEKKGVVLFKDSSTNKVGSMRLSWLASLS